MRQILSNQVKGYKPYMEVHIVSELDMLPENEFNEIMDGIVQNNQKVIIKFAVMAEKIVKEL